MVKGIHRGAVIHHQLQLITLRSFNTKNTKNSIPQNPILIPELGDGVELLIFIFFYFINYYIKYFL